MTDRCHVALAKIYIRHDGARRAREAANFAEPRGAQRPIDDVVLARLAGERVWSLLSTLSDGERSAIVLAYFAGNSYGQVAHLLDQPKGTVKSRIRLGLAKLRPTIDTAKTPPTPPLRQTLRS